MRNNRDKIFLMGVIWEINRINQNWVWWNKEWYKKLLSKKFEEGAQKW